MIYKNYTDLGLTAEKKPFNAHLIWETNSSGTLYMVDSTDQKVLLKSTDKGDTWSTAITRTQKIQSGWHDRVAGRIYFVDCDNDGVATTFDSWYILLSDDSENAQDTYNNAVEQYVYDIIYSTTDTAYYVLGAEDVGGGSIEMSMYKLIVGVWTFRDNEATFDAVSYLIPDIVFVGGTFPACVVKLNGGNVHLMAWVDGTPAFFDVVDLGANTDLPTSWDQRGINSDGTFLWFSIKDTADANKIKLWNVKESTAAATKGAEYNISIMLERNTNSVQEKAFHLTEFKVYEFHANTGKLHLIAQPALSDVIVAITDNFFIADDGGATWEPWEYEDVEASVMEAPINMKKMGAWSATISLLSTYPLVQGMFITITDMFTTAGASASQIIFEGFVTNFVDRVVQVANLVSPAQRDLDNEFPVGDYSGRTDEIIVDLIGDYCDYITVGVDSNGMAMGTITFGGDKTLREILDEFALQDHFIWYLTPTGALYYNDGTVDSVENFTAASPITNVDKTYGNRAKNFIDIKGGFVSGAQVSGTVAENIPDQQTNGRNPFEDTFSHLDLAAQCTTTNTNVLARLGTQPLIVPFTHADATVGVIQPGETITFEYGLADPNITSDQFLILDCIYDAKQGKANYRISDIVI